jgi:hypothetical protein
MCSTVLRNADGICVVVKSLYIGTGVQHRGVKFGRAAVIKAMPIAYRESRFGPLAGHEHYLRAKNNFGSPIGWNSFGRVVVQTR